MKQSELERYGTIESWSHELNLSGATIKPLVENSPGVLGKDFSGRVRIFYAEHDVREACRKLCALPQADDDGFLRIQNKETTMRYGSAHAWSQEIGCSQDAVSRRIEGLQGIEGRGRGGVVGIFYSEADIRQRCADLFAALEIDENGETYVQGVVCIAVNKFSRRIKMRTKTLSEAIEQAKLRPVALARSGVQQVSVYEKKSVEALNVIQSRRSVLDESGMIIVDGILCVGLSAYARANNWDEGWLTKEAREAGLQPKGRAQSRGISKIKVDVYEQSQVDALPFVLRRRQKLNKEGEVLMGDIPCVDLRRYAKARKISHYGLFRKVQKAQLPVIGMASCPEGNGVVPVYERAAVERLDHCTLSMAQLDEKGEVIVGGKVGIGIHKFADLYGLSFADLRRDIRSAQLAVIGQGLSFQQVVDLYDKDEVLKLPYVKRRSFPDSFVGTLRSQILTMYSPVKWASMDCAEKQKLRIAGLGENAIAGFFGIKGNPANVHRDHLALGQVVFGVDCEETLRTFVRSELDAKYGPAIWAAMSVKEKLAVEVEYVGKLNAIATLFGVIGNPAGNHAVHLRVGQAIWGNSWLQE